MGTQGRNPEASTEAEVGGITYRLAPQGLFTLLSYTIQDFLRRCGTTHSGLGPPTLIINQENAPEACPQGDLGEASS